MADVVICKQQALKPVFQIKCMTIIDGDVILNIIYVSIYVTFG